MSRNQIKKALSTQSSIGDCEFQYMDRASLLQKIINIDSYPVTRSEGKINLLCSAIKRQGILTPILLHRTAEGLELIDGMKRIFCAIEEKISPIPVLICDQVPNSDTAFLTINNIRFRHCGFEMLSAVYVLVTERGVGVNEVAASLMKKEKTIRNWISVMSRFYKVHYPDMNEDEYLEFRKLVDGECVTESKLSACIQSTENAEALMNCLHGKFHYEGRKHGEDEAIINDAVRRAREKGLTPHDIDTALIVWEEAKRNDEVMKCIEDAYSKQDWKDGRKDGEEGRRGRIGSL